MAANAAAAGEASQSAGQGLVAGLPEKIFVGNLPFSYTNEKLKGLCVQFGAIKGVNIRSDRKTNKSRGFGFVTFSKPEEAQAAITGLAGAVLEGRTLSVHSAFARGQSGAATQAGSEAAESGAWVTAPPKRRSRKKRENMHYAIDKGTAHRSSARSNSGHRPVQGKKPNPKSWTEWASLPNS